MAKIANSLSARSAALRQISFRLPVPTESIPPTSAESATISFTSLSVGVLKSSYSLSLAVNPPLFNTSSNPFDAFRVLLSATTSILSGKPHFFKIFADFLSNPLAISTALRSTVCCLPQGQFLRSSTIFLIFILIRSHFKYGDFVCAVRS